MRRVVIPAVALGLLFLGGAWWFALSRTTPTEQSTAEARKPATAPEIVPAMSPRSAVIAVPEAPARNASPTPAQLAKYEMRDAIRDTADLRAYYDRVKDLPDPTGERAYRLAEAIFECTAFMDLPMPELSKRLALTQKARESPRRQEVFTAMVERCKGFAGDPAAVSALMQSLHRKAEAAEYPPALARSLRMDVGRRDPEAADRMATSLLTGTLDPDVIHELAPYLNQRTAGDPSYRGIDAAARSVAWGLLECQYGADCGPRSRPVVMTCVAYGECDIQRIEEAVLVQGSQATVNNATVLRDRLARQIAERDWAGVGLAPKPKPP